MKNNFNIYLLGLTSELNNILFNALKNNFNVIILNTTQLEKIKSSELMLLVFNHTISQRVLKIQRTHPRKNAPLIAWINSNIEPETTKLSLLESGIDDIFVYEMSDKEKIARIEKIIKIFLETSQKIISISGLILDKSIKMATYKNDNLQLSKIEFDILYTLFENFKMEISREKLAKTIWEKQLSNNLNKHLSNIKKKIEQTPIEISSRRGKGITVQLKEIF